MKLKNYFFIKFSKNELRKRYLYQSLFKLKYDKMQQEIELLENKRDKLKEVLQDLLTNETSKSIMGIECTTFSHVLSVAKINSSRWNYY